MDISKQELQTKQQENVKKATLKFGLSTTPFFIVMIAYLYLVKPQEGDTEPLIAFTFYALSNIILAIPYALKLIKLKKEYEQQLSELDSE